MAYLFITVLSKRARVLGLIYGCEWNEYLSLVWLSVAILLGIQLGIHSHCLHLFYHLYVCGMLIMVQPTVEAELCCM